MSDLKDIFAEAEAEASGEGYAESVSTNPNDATDYEALSYGKVGYKRVQRLRKKGKRRKIEVPRLGYELHKPDRPRIVFWVLAAVAAVLMVGAIIGSVFLINMVVKTQKNFNGLGDIFKAAFNPTIFAVSLGMSVLPALMILFVYFMLFMLILIPVLVGLYLYTFVRDALYLARCSKEEFAKGYDVSGRITRLVVCLIIATVAFVTVMYLAPVKHMRLLLGFVYACFVLVFGGLLAILLLARAKDAKWFESLDEAQKQNFLAHDAGLRKVKKRLRSERAFWDSTNPFR